MGRWQPDACGRLQQAALDLYSERGFEQTTVADIAARAGLTERTFFRHFTDKREVLFSGSSALLQLFVQTIAAAPPAATPLEAATAALHAAGTEFEQRREHARLRRGVVSQNAELQEREVSKLASLATAIADALRGRGVADPAAGLTAEIAVAIFKIAFERWVVQSTKREFVEFIDESLEELAGLTADRPDIRRAKA